MVGFVVGIGTDAVWTASASTAFAVDAARSSWLELIA